MILLKLFFSPGLPGLRTDESALIGSKMQVSQTLCSRELSPKSYGCLAPEGRHLECRGRKRRKPTAPHQLARRAASAQFSNTTCSIEPPLNPCHRRLHQLRLDKSYPRWLTNYSPPRRLRPVDRGLAPTALKMPPLPGLRTDESALIGSKRHVSQLLCSRELSPKSYGCLTR